MKEKKGFNYRLKQAASNKQGSKFAHATMMHPCFSDKAHSECARLHLPVAPKCNVQCNFCRRSINKCENRPGVASRILNADEALEKVRKTIKEYPQLTVVGVAGPGDSLANDATFIVLEKVHQEFPKLIMCVATNGLLLPKKVDALVKAGVKTLTVTVNAVDPAIAAKIYEFIFYEGKKYTGEQAGEILIKNQTEGIKLATKKGICVKVNTVLIPGVNDQHVEEIAKKVSKLGAFKMNIIPLLPLHNFKDRRSPTCVELRTSRDLCEQHIPQFRLCKMCRADACGIPGLEKGNLNRDEDTCISH